MKSHVLIEKRKVCGSCVNHFVCLVVSVWLFTTRTKKNKKKKE